MVAIPHKIPGDLNRTADCTLIFPLRYKPCHPYNNRPHWYLPCPSQILFFGKCISDISAMQVCFPQSQQLPDYHGTNTTNLFNKDTCPSYTKLTSYIHWWKQGAYLIFMHIGILSCFISPHLNTRILFTFYKITGTDQKRKGLHVNEDITLIFIIHNIIIDLRVINTISRKAGNSPEHQHCQGCTGRVALLAGDVPLSKSFPNKNCWSEPPSQWHPYCC